MTTSWEAQVQALIALTFLSSLVLILRARMVNGLRVGDQWRGWIVSGVAGESVMLTSLCGTKQMYVRRKGLWKVTE